jgi:uncharacterized membrane protein YebE (DUF533 family)
MSEKAKRYIQHFTVESSHREEFEHWLASAYVSPTLKENIARLVRDGERLHLVVETEQVLDRITVKSIRSAFVALPSDSPASDSSVRANPPAVGGFLARLLLSKRKADGLLGDLQETFNENCAIRGQRHAR